LYSRLGVLKRAGRGFLNSTSIASYADADSRGVNVFDEFDIGNGVESPSR
jgi:hypothetical protein